MEQTKEFNDGKIGPDTKIKVRCKLCNRPFTIKAYEILWKTHGKHCYKKTKQWKHDNLVVNRAIRRDNEKAEKKGFLKSAFIFDV